MKKQPFFFLVFILASVLIFSSCKKTDSTPTPTPKTKTQLISQSTWKFKTATAGGTDVSSQLPACQKDNILTFVAAGTGTVDEGATKCNAGDPQTTSFNWNFATSETILHVSTPLFSNTGNDFTLISLTETELVVSIVYTPVGGPSITMVITFQH